MTNTVNNTTCAIRIIGTSDLHGKFVPWNYALNSESTSGSMAQLYSAIERYRTENTLVLDAGDTIQDNSADIFVNDRDIHPMVLAINSIRYDACEIGNHDFNYGMPILEKMIKDMDCKMLNGNVYGRDNKPIADGYALFQRNGIRIAVIGMVTPNIVRWDAANLEGCRVTDPLEETRRIIEAIKGKYDILIGVFHMGIDNEYGTPNSGVTDICNACPEFDVMISAHMHTKIPGKEINGVLVVQNKEMAQTMAVIDLNMEKQNDDWKVAGKHSDSVDIGVFEPSPVIMEQLDTYDKVARKNAEVIVGRLEEGPLAQKNDFKDIPLAMIQNTALMEFINSVCLYYSGAKVSASALPTPDANLFPGEIRKCDTALIYKFNNTLYKLHMTGAQLKKYMEWSACFYNTYHKGDLTISFRGDIPEYNYDMFSGVNYEIDVSREPWNRIENLTWPDGTAVEDSDEFDIAVNNYRANSHLLVPGEIYEEDELPTLVEKDVHGELGGIRELICHYIVDVKEGVIRPMTNYRWRIVGNNWDETLHKKAIELVASGVLTIPKSEEGKEKKNIASLTEADVLKYV